MKINYELLGIILQFTAGWIFVLDLIVHKCSDAIKTTLVKYRDKVFNAINARTGNFLSLLIKQAFSHSV